MTFEDSGNLKVARYERLAWQLSKRIRSGSWLAGGKLPSIRRLAEEYETAPVTVGKAVKALEEAGLVICRPNRGFYVNSLEELRRHRGLQALQAENIETETGSNEPDKVLHFIFHLESLKSYTGSFYPEILCLMQEEAEAAGWRLRVGDSKKLPGILQESTGSSPASGIVYMPDCEYPYDLNWPELSVPRVLMSLGEKSMDANYVTPDNYRGGYLAARQLSSHCCSLAGISSGFTGKDLFRYKLYEQRFTGMCDYCRQHRLPSPVLLNPHDPESFAAQFRRFLQQPRDLRPALVLLGDILHEEIRERFFELSSGLKLTAEFEVAIFQDFDTVTLPECHLIQFSRRLFCREVIQLMNRIGEYPQGQPISVKIPMTFTSCKQK